MSLEACIKQIITDNFKQNDYFDSHAVINELLKDKDGHLAYLTEYPKNCPVAQYHGQIAQKIEVSGLATKTDLKIKTHTIYGELKENQLWQKR